MKQNIYQSSMELINLYKCPVPILAEYYFNSLHQSKFDRATAIDSILILYGWIY